MFCTYKGENRFKKYDHVYYMYIFLKQIERYCFRSDERVIYNIAGCRDKSI